MADTDAQSSEKLTPQFGLFAVTGYDLKVIRELSASGFAGHGTNYLNFATSVHGVAVASNDMVCVHGTDRHSREFALTVRSDARAAEEWQAYVSVSEPRVERDRGESVSVDKEERLESWVKGVHETGATSQKREFEGSPPTARLYGPPVFADGWHKDDWCIDVMIPSPVLEQLITDVSDHRAAAINISIRWAGAFTPQSGALATAAPDRASLMRAVDEAFGLRRWWLIGGSDDRPPDPLRGHVAGFSWKLAPRDAGSARPLPERLQQQAGEWLASECKESNARDFAAMGAIAESAALWCHHNDAEADLIPRLVNATVFAQGLDEVLHAIDRFSRDYDLWHHRSFGDVTAVAATGNFIDSELLGSLVNEYLTSPWLNNRYLDWLFLDSMLFDQLSRIFMDFATAKHGVAFALACGIGWRMAVWKVALKLLGLLSWVLPAVTCYFIARWSL
ncbi:MAG TPA: hypothetical protein VKG79_11845, partial [Bryobacteraceae bacterium]|nr:hypothetical protein [Bryobacteraceae bacterium]